MERSLGHIWLHLTLHPAVGTDEREDALCRRPEGPAFSMYFAEAKERN